MATFVSLIKWTDQGVRRSKTRSNERSPSRPSPRRAGNVVGLYGTPGEYDLVSRGARRRDGHGDAPAGGCARERATTMEAFDRDAFKWIIAKTG